MGATIEKIEDIDGRLGQSKTTIIVTTESMEVREITLFTERIIETIGRIRFFEVKLDEERRTLSLFPQEKFCSSSITKW